MIRAIRASPIARFICSTGASSRSLRRLAWRSSSAPNTSLGDGWKLAAGSYVEIFAGGDVGEIVLFAQTAIDVASNASGERALDAGAIATNQNGERDFGMRFIGVSEKPADVGKLIGASAGFSSGHFIATGIKAAFASTVENRGQHAFPQFGKQRSDV